MMKRALVGIVVLTGCYQPGFKGTDKQLAEALGKELLAACPMAMADDENARSQCAQKLTDSTLLRENLGDPFLWGQAEDAGVPDLQDSVTRFSPLVWRRLYLSTYMFPDQGDVEVRSDGITVLHVAAKFRNKLDMGSYPYPFWHRWGKWLAYEKAEELLFMIQKGKVLGSKRSWAGTEGRFYVPAERPEVVHEWGGQWTWSLDGEEYPKAVLYTWLLSKDNPVRAQLEESFRDLEHEMRQSSCMLCHQPDNASNMKVLELFSYPNQALSARHRIVQSIENNAMPYPDTIRGVKAGFHGGDEQKNRMLDLAKKFAQLGDQALMYEGEPIR
jgi:hypothetical protein